MTKDQNDSSTPPRLREYAEKIKRLQNIPLPESFRLHGETRYIIGEVNVFLRRNGDEKRKLDSPVTCGQYLAYLKHMIENNHTDFDNPPTKGASQMIQRKRVEAFLEVLTSDVLTTPSTIYPGRFFVDAIDKYMGTNFDAMRKRLSGLIQNELIMLELNAPGGNRAAPPGMPTDPVEMKKLGAEKIELMKQKDSEARQRKVIRMHLDGATVKDIDLSLNGTPAGSIRDFNRLARIALADAPQDPHIATIVGEVVSKDIPGHHPVIAPQPTDSIHLHNDLIHRLRAHEAIIEIIAQNYDMIFGKGRGGGAGQISP